MIAFVFATKMYSEKYWLRGTDGGPSGTTANCLFWSGTFDNIYDEGDDAHADDILCIGLNTSNLIATRFNPRANGYGDPNIQYAIVYAATLSVYATLGYKIYEEIALSNRQK